jgi:hypothetical protein
MKACDDQDVSVRISAISALRTSRAPEAVLFLQSRNMQPVTTPRESEAMKSRARRKMVIGALFVVGGALVTTITYSLAANSPTGGTYFVFWGAMVFGFVDLVVGAYGYWKASRRIS